VFNGILDGFLEFDLDFFETTDIVPADGWNFNNGFTKGRWVRDTKGKL
jgi:hypothetical protein